MQSDQVTRYLLGQLPESEMQRLHQLRQTDENFRQRVTIVEDDLIDCFTKGQLQGEDLMRFRRYFLAAHANRERVKMAQGFLDDLNVVYADAPPERFARWLPPTLRAHWQTYGQSVRNFWAAAREPLLLGARGVLLLLLVWGFWLAVELILLQRRYAQNEAAQAELKLPVTQPAPSPASSPAGGDQLARQIEAARAAADQLKTAALNPESTPASATAPSGVNAAELQPASFALRPAARGAEGVPELTLNPAADDIAFQLELGRDDRASFRAELRAQPDGARLWQSGTLKARAKDYGKVLEVHIPAAYLKARAYTLKVYGANATGGAEESLNYSFRINKP